MRVFRTTLFLVSILFLLTVIGCAQTVQFRRPVTVELYVADGEHQEWIVVVPFARHQFAKVMTSLTSWVHFPACEKTCFDLALISSHIRRDMVKTLQTIPKIPGVCKFTLYRSSIPRSMDSYFYGPPYFFYEAVFGYDFLAGRSKHIKGPSLTSAYKFMLQVEPDVHVLRLHWFDRILSSVKHQATQFWMLGSNYDWQKCYRLRPVGGPDGISGFEPEINGNAVYNVTDLGFRQFMLAVRDFYDFNTLKQQIPWFDGGFGRYIASTRRRTLTKYFVQALFYWHCPYGLPDVSMLRKHYVLLHASSRYVSDPDVTMARYRNKSW